MQTNILYKLKTTKIAHTKNLCKIITTQTQLQSQIYFQVEGRSLRPHRGALARQGAKGGRGIRAKLAKRKGSGGRKARRRGKNGKRRGRQDEAIPDADVVTDDAAAPAEGGEEGEVRFV